MKRIWFALVFGAFVIQSAAAVAQFNDTFDKAEKKRAEGGDPTAEWALGQFYLHDHYHESAMDKVLMGVTHDKPKPAEAAKWLHRAADNGYVNAQQEAVLASMYIHQADYPEAVFWLRRAADHGDASSLESLGDCYALGHGVAKEGREALRWYGKAALAGVKASGGESWFAIGSAYYEIKDYGQALAFFTPSAQANNLDAMQMLGVMYRDGVGVVANASIAQGWFNVRQRYLDQQAQQDAALKQQQKADRAANRAATWNAVMTGLANGLNGDVSGSNSNSIQDARNQQINNINAVRDQQIRAQQQAQAANSGANSQQNSTNVPAMDCIGGGHPSPGHPCLIAAR